MKNWFDPTAWPSGSVPGPNDMAVVQGDIVLSGTVKVCEVHITSGSRLLFDPGANCQLLSCCNVCVEGVLEMQPVVSVVHRLTFVNVDETKFVGGGTVMLDTDVGVWVMGDGQLVANGANKTGWTRSGWDPTWNVGDEVFSAPVKSGDFTTFAPFASGSVPASVTLCGRKFTAETFNLTRNVVIEGSGDGSASPLQNGRVHLMFMMTTKPQVIRNALLRHVGPRKSSTVDPTEPVLGRWGVHFHKCTDASRGSVVENVVVRDCGSHSFVAHKSHGVTFKQCVSFNSWESAYWWDHDEKDALGNLVLNQSDDTTYDTCAAFMVQCDPSYRGFRSTGFELVYGQRNSCINCVTAGVQGTLNASGYYWAEAPDYRPFVTWPRQYTTPWLFDGNVAHNNAVNGIFVWQNLQRLDRITNFTAYNCGRAGIEHGAYVNTFFYDGTIGTGISLLGCSVAGVICTATSHADPIQRLRFAKLLIDCGAHPCVYLPSHVAQLPFPITKFTDCSFYVSSSMPAVIVNEQGPFLAPGLFGFLRCNVNNNEMSTSDVKTIFMYPSSSIYIEKKDGTCSAVKVASMPTHFLSSSV